MKRYRDICSTATLSDYPHKQGVADRYADGDVEEDEDDDDDDDDDDEEGGDGDGGGGTTDVLVISCAGANEE